LAGEGFHRRREGGRYLEYLITPMASLIGYLKPGSDLQLDAVLKLKRRARDGMLI